MIIRTIKQGRVIVGGFSYRITENPTFDGDYVLVRPFGRLGIYVWYVDGHIESPEGYRLVFWGQFQPYYEEE